MPDRPAHPSAITAGSPPAWVYPGLPPSLRILVVEDDYLQADRLSSEIRRSGNELVGPFRDIHQAMPHAELAQAAILDVRVQQDTSFAIADVLLGKAVPFVFLTGYGGGDIPLRFGRDNVFLKPSPTTSLILALRDRHRAATLRSAGLSEATEIGDVLSGLIGLAGAMMPDRALAERLVESTIRRAMAQLGDELFEIGNRDRLLLMLDEECRRAASPR